ncbi:hypothetical protein LA76x_3006 [Lysobacter antibioticus]|uniref:Uncharacterized protein n=1 Tax=Lysobacter antibioticus TaxID=84531 RepID=A0A0S2FC72_LYSAN|nr:hypothetical protein LA76x_3006 [Lysobacter antibioticus]
MVDDVGRVGSSREIGVYDTRHSIGFSSHSGEFEMRRESQAMRVAVACPRGRPA